jgi:hypothetical protein
MPTPTISPNLWVLRATALLCMLDDWASNDDLIKN